MTNLATLRSELTENKMDVLTSANAFMIKGGKKGSKKSRKSRNSRKSRKSNNGNGWGCGCGW